jgi:maltose 6'-phosphate phosphatase
LKLLTLNVHSWQEENQLQKIRYIASVIKENEYDVIAMQEVSQLISEEIVYENIKKNNFAYLLNKELENLGIKSYKVFWDISHIGYDLYEEGLCLMTKLPIKECESFYISKSEDINYWKSRKITKMKIDYNGIDVSFYSCHLGWWNDEDEPFIYQFDNLNKDIQKEGIAFIMGDFNNSATIREEGYDYMIKKVMLDTYNLAKEKDNGISVKGKIAGWDKNKSDLRLDLILVNKSVDVDSSNVIFNGKNKEIVSDHFGIDVKVNI